MNTRPPQPSQAPAPEPANPDTEERPEKPSKPAPRRKFVLPTFGGTPLPSPIDYRTFLSDAGIRR